MKSLRVVPLVTEKSMALASANLYQFVVPTWAGKREIAAVIHTLFGVTVLSVTTANYQSKATRFRGKNGTHPKYKKATIRLEKGQSIGEFSMPVEKEAPSRSPASKETKEPTVKTESRVTVRSKSKKES